MSIMLTIKASVKPSPIDGLGLFAAERIPRGTIVWKFNPRFDLTFDPQEFTQMGERERNFILHYAYLSKTSGKYILSVDDSRFTNHSTQNNLDSILIPEEPEVYEIANRDIETGEELLLNYRVFDANDATSEEEYLNS